MSGHGAEEYSHCKAPTISRKVVLWVLFIYLLRIVKFKDIMKVKTQYVIKKMKEQ